MDYLDPTKKKAHRNRLFVGYGLIAIAIAFATVILVYVGSGFYVDSQTGTLIQNGQIFLNSNPEGASVYLNNKLQKTKTTGKLVIPSGSYDVSMKKDGYRDWSLQVQLEGGKVQSLDYALLIPANIKSSIVQTYSKSPTDVSQSSDRRFFSLVFADKPNTVLFYDLTKPEIAPKEVNIDKSLFTDPNKIGSLVISEWSNDTKKVLIQNKIGADVQDYLVISRVDGDKSYNLTKTFLIKDAVYSLKEGLPDEYFVYNKTSKNLSNINLSDKTLVSRLDNVLQYKTFNNDTIAYITDQGASSGKVQARITDGLSKTFLLRELPISTTKYLLDVAKIGTTSAVVLGTPSENKVTVLRNPVGYLKSNPEKTIPLATTIFLLDNPTEVSFSTDASVVMARSGQKIATHYFEEDRTSRYELPIKLGASKLRWSDGKHLQTVSEGSAYIFDYEGSNLQKLVETSELFNVYFDSNYRSLYSFDSKAKLFNMSRSIIKIEN